MLPNIICIQIERKLNKNIYGHKHNLDQYPQQNLFKLISILTKQDRSKLSSLTNFLIRTKTFLKLVSWNRKALEKNHKGNALTMVESYFLN